MIGAGRPSIAMVLDHPTTVGEARRRAMVVADRLGFDESRRGRVALIVTEAASNLVKHSASGELVVQGRMVEPDSGRLDVLALDRGPGMSDVGRCLADGYSTAGSPGTGLGAIGRLADEFAIYSAPVTGTALWSCIGSGRSMADRLPSLKLAVVSVAAPGEEECGDEWAALSGKA